MSKSPFLSECSVWCGRTWLLQVSCLPLILKQASGMPSSLTASYGLGENVVQGSVNPDEYYVFKPTLQLGFRPVIQKILGSKEFKLVYDIGGSKMVKNVPVAPDDRNRFAITDEEILTLARWGCVIEEHYAAKKGLPSPMDIEWAKDGHTGDLFIVQARPETVQSRKVADTMEVYQLKQRGPGAC